MLQYGRLHAVTQTPRVGVGHLSEILRPGSPKYIQRQILDCKRKEENVKAKESPESIEAFTWERIYSRNRLISIKGSRRAKKYYEVVT